jgi:hypothetical protein
MSPRRLSFDPLPGRTSLPLALRFAVSTRDRLFVAPHVKACRAVELAPLRLRNGKAHVWAGASVHLGAHGRLIFVPERGWGRYRGVQYPSIFGQGGGCIMGTVHPLQQFGSQLSRDEMIFSRGNQGRQGLFLPLYGVLKASPTITF